MSKTVDLVIVAGDANADTFVVASISIPNCPGQLFDDAASSSIMTASR